MVLFLIGMLIFAYIEYKKTRENTYVNTNDGKLYIVRNVADLLDVNGKPHRCVIAFDIDNNNEITIDIRFFKEYFKKYYVQ